MRFPVQDWSQWYDAQPFGTKTTYGYHEGGDLNLKTGGDTDLGQPLVAISPFVITNYKEFSTVPLQPGQTPNWGIKVEYRIDGPWGSRWVQMSHLRRVAERPGFKGNEGDFVAELGKNGTTAAHVHFALAKNPNCFDKIAHTQEELNANWEDPIAFIQKWLNATPPANDQYEALRKEVQQLREAQRYLQDENNQQKTQIGDLYNAVTDLKRRLEAVKNAL